MFEAWPADPATAATTDFDFRLKVDGPAIGNGVWPSGLSGEQYDATGATRSGLTDSGPLDSTAIDSSLGFRPFYLDGSDAYIKTEALYGNSTELTYSFMLKPDADMSSAAVLFELYFDHTHIVLESDGRIKTQWRTVGDGSGDHGPFYTTETVSKEEWNHVHVRVSTLTGTAEVTVNGVTATHTFTPADELRGFSNMGILAGHTGGNKFQGWAGEIYINSGEYRPYTDFWDGSTPVDVTEFAIGSADFFLGGALTGDHLDGTKLLGTSTKPLFQGTLFPDNSTKAYRKAFDADTWRDWRDSDRGIYDAAADDYDLEADYELIKTSDEPAEQMRVFDDGFYFYTEFKVSGALLAKNTLFNIGGDILRWYNSQDTFDFFLSDTDGGTERTISLSLAGIPDVEDDAWHSLAIEWDGSNGTDNVTLHVDGDPVSTADWSYDAMYFGSSGTSLYLGATSGRLPGKVRNFTLANRRPTTTPAAESFIAAGVSGTLIITGNTEQIVSGQGYSLLGSHQKLVGAGYTSTLVTGTSFSATGSPASLVVGGHVAPLIHTVSFMGPAGSGGPFISTGYASTLSLATDTRLRGTGGNVRIRGALAVPASGLRLRGTMLTALHTGYAATLTVTTAQSAVLTGQQKQVRVTGYSGTGTWHLLVPARARTVGSNDPPRSLTVKAAARTCRPHP